MVLVDTSVWVGHLKGLSEALPLAELLEELEVISHPCILGELVLGGLDTEPRELFEALPRCEIATDREVVALVDAENLAGRGIGWVDVHLLAAALLTGCPLWTMDQKLSQVARSLSIDWSPG